MPRTLVAAFALLAAGGGATAGAVIVARMVAASRRKAFLTSLGPVVRIATPSRLPKGRALVPGTLALTPRGLVWDALFDLSGSAPFSAVKRLETDATLLGGRAFLRSGVVRVTLEAGPVHEFVVGNGHLWEWRQALGEWVGAGGRIRGAAESPGTGVAE